MLACACLYMYVCMYVCMYLFFSLLLLLLAEIADPDGASSARYVELYNDGCDPLDLAMFALQRFTVRRCVCLRKRVCVCVCKRARARSLLA